MNQINTGNIFLLHHVREDESSEDVKLIGAFSSKKKAEEIKNEMVVLPGFKDYPKGFSIDEYIIDKKYWEEGFG